MTLKLSERINNIAGSKSIGMAAVVEEMRRQGKKVISFNVGEPDFQTPKPIIEATKKALDENKTRYSLVAGLKKLRESLADKLSRDNGIKVTSENILLGSGSKHILYSIFQTICDPGDEIIIPIPYWVTFPESVKLAGGVPVFVDTVENQLSSEFIEKAITDKTKAILINSPNNPTGAIYSDSTLREIAALAKKHDLYIISDDAYELLTFGTDEHVNIAAFDDETFKRTLTVQTFSKSYCMTGFRIGYLIADHDVIKGVNKLHSHLTGNNVTFAQYGALAALEIPSSSLYEMIQVMEKRRDLAYELCKDIFEVIKPQGAFYLWPKIDKWLGKQFNNSDEMAMYILEKAGVAVLPGSAFGDDRHLRFSFACSEEDIQAGFEKIKLALKEIE